MEAIPATEKIKNTMNTTTASDINANITAAQPGGGYVAGQQNKWPSRLHAARLALSHGTATGDEIADAYAAAQAAVNRLAALVVAEGHESWNESPAEKAERLARNAAKRAALMGLPALRVEVSA